jgi:hypothetical protein
LPCLNSGVPEGGDHDEPVAVPLGGLAEPDAERLVGMTLPSGKVTSLGGPGGMGDDGDPSPLPN